MLQMKTFQCWLSYSNLTPLCPINSLFDVFLELIPLLHSLTPLLPTSFPVSFSTLFNFFFHIPPYYQTSYNPWSPSLNPHVTWSHSQSYSQHNSSFSPVVHGDSLAHLALEWRNWHIYFMLLCGFLIFIPQHLIHCLHEEDNEWWTDWMSAYVLLILWHIFLFSEEVFVVHQKSFS